MKKSLLIVAVTLLFSYSHARAQWVPTNVPGYNTYTDEISNAVSLHGTLFVGSNFGGLYYSTNNGKVWIHLNDTLFLNGTVSPLTVRGDSLFVNAQDGLYFSTNEGSDWTLIPPPHSRFPGEYVFSENNILCLTDTGLFCSSNTGADWVMTDSLWGRYDHRVSIILYTTDTIFVFAPDSSLFISNDGGFHWKPFVSMGSPLYPLKQFYPVGKGALYIWTDSGLFYSSNTGESWTAAKDSGLPVSRVTYFFKSYSGHLFAETDSQIFISGTNGANWIVADSGLPSHCRVWQIVQCGFNILLATDSGTYFMADTGGVWSAVDFGSADFHEGPYTRVTLDMTNFISIGDTIFAGSNTGFFYTTNNGATWVLANAGLDHSTVPSLAVVGNTLFASHPEEPGASVIFTTDNGDTWQLSKYFPDSTDILASNGKVLLAGGGFGINRSVDSGMSWHHVDSGIGNNVYVIALAMDGDSCIVETANNGKYCSTDGGAKWISLDSTAIFMGGYFPSLLLKGNNVYESIEYDGVDWSTDFGRSWGRSLYLLSNAFINALAGNRNNVFAGGITGVFRLSDSGTNWVVVNNGLTDSIITALISTGDSLFAGTSDGKVFFSPDNGDNWKDASDALGAYGAVLSFAICHGELFVGEINGGVWRRPLSEFKLTDVKKEEHDISPASAGLQQNYPNPFSTSTTISYTLPQSANVILKIYNALGEEVATPVNGMENAGAQDVSFSAAQLSMGVYFYRLQVGALTTERKMLIVK